MSKCEHYDCSVDIQCFSCKEYFNCRVCHDFQKDEEEKDPSRRHILDRYMVEAVRCRNCETTQPPEQYCINCGICFGNFFCKICRLYENNLGKNIYHCDGCKICRRGPKEDTFHCNTCEACLNIGSKNTHKCTIGSIKINCPICQEFLFYSRSEITPMKCGHYIHISCLNEMVNNQHYTCPLCLKYIIADIRSLTEALDNHVAATIMPEEFKSRKVDILCHECGTKGQTLFNISGLKCESCGVYNTSRYQ